MARILCVEDEELLRRDIALELEDAGHEVFQAEDGKEGLKAILEVRPDLVLCDINMPQMNGHQLLEELRNNHPAAADLPFIFLTAFSDQRDVLKGLGLGADDYLTKPINFDLLLAKVDAILRQVGRMLEKKEREQVKLYKKITEEQKGSKVVETVTSDEAVKAFEDHLRSLQSKGVKGAAGRLHFINLGNVKAFLGDRWERISKNALSIAESTIKASLDTHDTFIRHDDEAFFLLLPHLSEEEGQLKADAIANKIGERLMGEDASSFRDLKLTTQIMDIESLNSGEAPASLKTLADKMDLEAPPASAGGSCAERFLSQVGISYFPIWSPNRETVIGFYATPVRTTSYGYFSGSDVLHGGAADPLAGDLDAYIVRQALEIIADNSRAVAPIVIPIHATSLTGGHQNEIIGVFKDILKALPSSSIMIEILGVSDHLGEKRLRQAIQIAASLAKTITVETDTSPFVLGTLKSMGVRFVGLNLQSNRGANSGAGLAEATFAKKALKEKILPYLKGVGTMNDAKSAVIAGYSLLIGTAIGEGKNLPRDGYELRKEKIIGV